MSAYVPDGPILKKGKWFQTGKNCQKEANLEICKEFYVLRAYDPDGPILKKWKHFGIV